MFLKDQENGQNLSVVTFHLQRKIDEAVVKNISFCTLLYFC